MKMGLLRLLLLLPFLIPLELSAQCSISASTQEGCIPTPISFSFNYSGGKTVARYTWLFRDNNRSNQASPLHVYRQRGTYKPKLILTFTDSSTCEAELTKEIQIYGNPEAELEVKKAYNLCWDDRFIRLQHKSKLSEDKARLTQFTWDLGNGDTSNNEYPLIFYENNGTKNIALEIQDENGCKDTVSARIKVRVFRPLQMDFTKYGSDSCPITIFKFVNETDTQNRHINKVTWRFGDGNSLSAKGSDPNFKLVFDSARHTYRKTGEFFPTLILESRFGCVDSLQKFDAENIWFRFNATASPDTLCFVNPDHPEVQFFQPDIQDANEIYWEFGDIANPFNSAYQNWAPRHTFRWPGKYSVTVRVRIRGCERDTTYCDMVSVYGPYARIQRERSRVNDTLPAYSFPRDTFPYVVDTCNTDSVVYYEIDTVLGRIPQLIFCNADTQRLEPFMLAKSCKRVFSRNRVILNPTQTIMKMGFQVNRYRKVWYPGDVLPKGPVYLRYTGSYVPGNIHDTDLFAPACDVPHTVIFNNNTIKYRLNEAIDDWPGMHPDKCRNPAYPNASDSIQYFWDFEEGTNDTSTFTSRDTLARYSTERVPTHTYTIPGCYKVVLIAYDPVTGCRSRDSVRITAQAPDAGWDTVAFDTIKRMTYRKQLELQNSGFRRGMQLVGLECTGSTQRVRLNEILPDCQVHRYWMVFDSAAAAYEEICGTDTVIKYRWVPSDLIPRNHLFDVYSTTGWKTVGIVVKSGDCFDTMWYHNYKYIWTVSDPFVTDNKHVCLGDTVNLRVANATQEGISYYSYRITYKYKFQDDELDIAHDTIPYIKYISKAGDTLDITSTLHDTVAGIVDDTSFNLLDHSYKLPINKPGHYIIEGVIEHRAGCEGSYVDEVHVGHYANFGANYRKVCVGDSIRFSDTVLYFADFDATVDGFNQNLYWKDPYFWRPGWTPANPEEMRWDLDGDGTIDHTGPNPKFAYDKPGLYDVILYTKDSLNCDWMETKKEDFIRVVSVDAKIVANNNDSVKFCAPQFFIFTDSSSFSDGEDGSNVRIGFWEFEWGDGDKTIKTSLDKDQVGRQYPRNGVFTVKMRTYLETYQVTNGDGCVDSAETTIRVIGPLPKFELVGDTIGCVPFTTRTHDLSRLSSVLVWQLGDGRTKVGSVGDTTDLHYQVPGTYCIALEAGDSLIDLQGDTLYCTARFPFDDPCEFEVEVLPKDPISIEWDTLLCLKESGNFTMIDTSSNYSSYKIDFGDGNNDSLDVKEFVHAYDYLDTFKLRFTGFGATCPDSGEVDVRVIDVLADIKVDSSRIDTPEFIFLNRSRSDVLNFWIVDNNLIREAPSEPDFSFVFEQPGEHEICLAVENERGCPDTACTQIRIDVGIRIPNVFTPNGDGINDVFQIPLKGETEFELLIFNRWGEKVFESSDKNYRWNGQVNNNGSQCSPGTYFYLLNYRLLGSELDRATGSITLLRE